LAKGVFCDILKARPKGRFKNANRKTMSFIQYLKDTKAELKHVSWPTRKQTMIYTILVIVISFFTALYLGLFDFVFKNLLDKIVF